MLTPMRGVVTVCLLLLLVAPVATAGGRDRYIKPVRRDGRVVQIAPDETVPMRSDSYACRVTLKWKSARFRHETNYAQMTFRRARTARRFARLLNDGRGAVGCWKTGNPG